MERLTKRLNDGKALCISECEKECTEGYYECHKCKPFADVMKKLAEYEDAEEQGLLLRLPLPEGTQVHCIGSCGEICDDYSTDCEVCGEHEVVFTTSFDRNMIEQFGKTVFAKEEEAEQALVEMKDK